MPSDLSSAGNPLPSDRTPEATSPSSAAVYRRYQELVADKSRQATLTTWVEDCRELLGVGDPKVGISLFFAEAEKGMQLNPLYGAHLILENWQILSQDGTYDVLLQSLAMASEALSGHPETLRDASRAAYYAASTALENLQDEEASFLWAHRALKLSKLADEANPWTGDCWLLVARSGPSNGMPEVAGAYRTALDLQAKIAAEVPEARFNLALGWKYYADHLDATNRRGEGLLALSEAAKQVALIPAKLRGYPEITAILAAHHGRRELG